MRSISQRELRNSSGEIMRGLERGESYVVTNRGVQVGRLLPAQRTALEDLTLRRGTGVVTFPERVRVSARSEDVLRALRGDR